MTKSISLVLMRTESLVVKLSVTLLDSKNSNTVYSIYETNIYDYITVNLVAYITIQYKPNLVDGSQQWDPSRTIRVNEMSMFTLLRGLKEFYSKYQREDLFTYYKSGMIECNATPEDKVTITLINNQFIELIPDVLVDNNNLVLPGVIMNLNNTDNKVKLSSDEYEAFMYKMNQTNIQAEALNLVTMSMIMEKDGKPVNPTISTTNQPQQKETVYRGVNIFQKKEEAMKVDSVQDKRIQVETPSSLDDL